MRLRLVVAIGGAVLIVGIVVALWVWRPGTLSPSGEGGPVLSAPRVIEPAVEQDLAAPGAKRPLLQQPPVPGPAVTSGRLVVAPTSAAPPASVSLELVACELVGPEAADTSLGGDANAWRDVGVRRPADAWTGSTWEWQALEPGMWRLVAGEESTHVPRGRSALPVEVLAGRTTSLDVDLVSAGVVFARLVRADGDGVAGAAVRVVGPLPPGCGEETDWGDLAGTRIRKMTTDDEGRFTLAALESGSSYGLHGWSDVGDTVTAVLLASHPPAEMQTLLVSEPRHIQVRVTARADSRALPGAMVQVVDDHLNRLRGIGRAESPGRPLREAGPTDGDGRVDITVEPGAWLIVVCEGFDIASLRVPPSLEDGTELPIALDAPGDGLVHVVSESGAPVAGATLEATVTSVVNGRMLRLDAGQAVSNAWGAVELERFDHWSGQRSGALRLAARDDVEGVGLELDIGGLIRAQRGLARTLVLRRPGNLEVDMAIHGWPQPKLDPFPNRFSSEDVRERQDKEHLFTLTLWYLGSPGLRTEFSTHHGAKRSLDPMGFAGGVSTARFDDLEPGDYCVELWSPARGISLISPALRVESGKTTHHWITAPDATSHGRVTVVPGGSTVPGIGDRMTLLPADGFAFHGALPVLLSPVVAMRDRHEPFDPSGRVTFDTVPPGRWVVGTASQDASGAVRWRQTPPFLLGPGDDLVLEVVLERASPPVGVVF